MEDQEMTIAEQLMYALANHMGGTVSLRRIADALWGDEHAIDDFYIVAYDLYFADMTLVDYLAMANVRIPPDPDTVTEDNLYETNQFGFYLYPRAVREAEEKANQPQEPPQESGE